MPTPTDNTPHHPVSRKIKYSWLIGLLLVVLSSVSMTGYWLLNSQSGLQWIFSTIHRLNPDVIQFGGIHGTLQAIQIDHVLFDRDELRLELHNVQIAWNPVDFLQKQINIRQITVETLRALLPPASASDSPPTLPASLQLPFAFSIHQIKVDAIHVTSAVGEQPALIVSDLTSSLASDGQRHQLNHLDFHTAWGSLSALATLNGSTPFDLSGKIDWSGAKHWGDTQAVIVGNLEQMIIQVNAKPPTEKRDLTLHLHPFAINPVTQLHAAIADIDPAIFLADAPHASLSVSANLAQNASGELEGRILVENYSANTLNNNGLPFSSISTQARITAEILVLQDIHAQMTANASMKGNLLWHFKGATGSGHLLINRLNPQHVDSRLRAAQVSGQIKLEDDTQKQTAHIQLKDQSISLMADVTRSDQQIKLQQFNLQHSKSRLTGKGKFDLGTVPAFEVSGQLTDFNIADFIQQAPASNLNAAIHLSGQWADRVAGTLNYTIQNSRWAKFPVTGSGEVTFNGPTQFKGNAALNLGANHFLTRGGIGQSGDTLLLTINAPSLEQIGFGVAGDLQSQIQLRGSLESPDMDLNIKSRQLHLPGNRHLSGLMARGQVNKENLAIKVAIENYAANEKTPINHLNLEVNGKISDHILLAKVQVHDETKIQLKAAGGVDVKTPLSSLRWNGQLTELSSSGKIPIRLMSPTTISISPAQASLGQTTFSISDGLIHIDQLQWTPQDWKTSGNFTGIALLPGEHPELKRPFLHLGGHWDFTSNTQLTGNLHIHREKGDWYLPGEVPQPIGLEIMQLKLAARDEKIAGKFELISQYIGTADAHLTLPIQQSSHRWSISEHAPLSGEVIANIANLKWMDSILGDSINIDGQLRTRARIQGTLNQPDFNGEASGKALSIALLEHGIHLQQGNLLASFHQSNLTIDQLSFITPPESPPDDRLLEDVQLGDQSGSLIITGNIGLVGNESALNFKLNQFPLTHKTDYWGIVSGSGQAKFHKNRLSLKSNIVADAGLLLQPPADRPELSEDVIFVNAPHSAQQKILLQLDANFDLGEKFFIRASGLEGRLAGQLKVQNDHRNTLKVNGSIAAQDTTFKAYGQHLKVKRGIVDFQGPLDDPGLNILAIRENLPVEAGVEIMGSVRHPRIKLVSTPDVPDTEKLSWIVLGRKPETTGLDTSLLLAAAGSILGGQSGGGITERISSALGVDEIAVKQASTGSPLSGQIGMVGKRISSRAYLSYERSLATTTMGITKLTYNLTPKITVVTQAGEDNAIDLFYTLQFD